MAIWNGDRIEVDLEGSGQERARDCEWTLEKYIRLSNARYPSKARFFCVKKDKSTYKSMVCMCSSILQHFFAVESENGDDSPVVSGRPC